jgi:hypothetical protein
MTTESALRRCRENLCDKCLAVYERGDWIWEDMCDKCQAKMSRLLDQGDAARGECGEHDAD